MKIFDSHAHIGKDYFLYNIRGERKFNLPLKKLVKLMDQEGVNKTIVSVCPSIEEITCCSLSDLFIENKEIISKCPKCKRVIAKFNSDPYRSYNLDLLKQIKELGVEKRIIPFFTIHLQNPFFKEEIEYYLKHYRNFGIKLHTFTSKRSVLSVRRYLRDLTIPILIHTGAEKYTHPQNVVTFAKSYSGNVLMAHAARLSRNWLNKINKVDNLFVDTSPITSFYKKIKQEDYSTILEDRRILESIDSVEDMYIYLLKNVSSKKLLFGSDIPWCNKFGKGYKYEIRALQRIKLDTNTKKDIVFNNCKRFLKGIS